MADVTERVARVETQLTSVNENLLFIKGYLERSTTERTVQHTATIERLTRIEVTQGAMAKNIEDYQDTCTEEREDHDERIGKIETHNAKAAGRASGIAAAVSVLMTGIGMGIEYLRKG